MWLLECPKAPISEHPSRVNVFTGIKHLWRDHGGILSELSIDPRNIEFEKFCVGEIWNLRTVWKHVDCRSHVFLSSDERNLRNVLKCHYLRKGKPFLEFLLHLRNLPKILCILKEKPQLYRFNISKVIDLEIYCHLNAQKILFQNTLWESPCSRVLNMAETTMAALFSELSIDARHIQLENISVSEIWNLTTAW